MAILVACRHLLFPIVRFLIRFGIGYREFSEVSKKVFVDVAAQDFGVRGRTTNTSRIAVLTGLPRKQVKRIREQEGIGEVGTTHMTQASLVLAAWFTDPVFQDKDGNPKKLQFDKDEVSFCDLVRKYGKDIPARSMLKELLRTGAVETLSDGRISAQNKTNLAKGADPESVRRAGAVVHHMLTTVTNNLMCENEKDLRFERRSFSTYLDPRYTTEFKKLVEIEGQRFVEKIDNWIVAHEIEPGEFSSTTNIIGAGVYMFEDRDALTA